MKSFRQSLPPLDCLIFFEAAARRLNFSAASKELFVSQAAVSKRIKQLEEWVGTPLFIRRGRHLLLTDEGASLLEKVRMTLEYIEMAIRPSEALQPNSVCLSANNAVSTFWLTPKLKAFNLSKDSCEVRLSTTNELAAQLGEETDLAIIYCDGSIAGWTCQPFIRCHMAPVAAPEYLLRHSLTKRCDLKQLFTRTDVVLLSYGRHMPEAINWESWLDATGYREKLRAGIRNCRTYSHSIGSALAGEGIALGSIHLLHAEIDSGQLVVMGSEPLSTPRNYYLCYPDDKLRSPQTLRLQSFLVDQALNSDVLPAIPH